jgi:hypothetical protein
MFHIKGAGLFGGYEVTVGWQRCTRLWVLMMLIWTRPRARSSFLRRCAEWPFEKRL